MSFDFQRGFVTGGADKSVKFWDFELVKDENSTQKRSVDIFCVFFFFFWSDNGEPLQGLWTCVFLLSSRGFFEFWFVFVEYLLFFLILSVMLGFL